MRRNWLEWAVLVASAIVLVGLVGFLVLDGLTDEGRPPRPTVRLDPAAAHGGIDAWFVPAIVRNDGDRAAESVELRAEATVGGQAEEAEVHIDYLPAGSEVEVTFGFGGEPDGEVRVRVVGFRLP